MVSYFNLGRHSLPVLLYMYLPLPVTITKSAEGPYFILAHLSRRLIGELIVYPCSGVRRRCRCRRRCLPPFSNVFSSETAWPIKAKFYVEPPWEGGTKVCIMVQVTRPRWPPCPYMVKTLKNLLLQNQLADFHETWYVASRTPAYYSLYK